MENEKFLIGVQAVGEPDNYRYFIYNNKCQVWDGEKWIDNNEVNVPCLYYKPQDTAPIVTSLYRKEFLKRKIVKHFEIPLIIETYSDEDVSCEEIRSWLLSALNFSVDYMNKGTGPREDVGSILTILDKKIKDISILNFNMGTIIDTNKIA